MGDTIQWATLLDQTPCWVPAADSQFDTRNFATDEDYAAMAGVGGRDLADVSMSGFSEEAEGTNEKAAGEDPFLNFSCKNIQALKELTLAEAQSPPPQAP